MLELGSHPCSDGLWCLNFNPCEHCLHFKLLWSLKMLNQAVAPGLSSGYLSCGVSCGQQVAMGERSNRGSSMYELESSIRNLVNQL